jgi:hypothetical protein
VAQFARDAERGTGLHTPGEDQTEEEDAASCRDCRECEDEKRNNGVGYPLP